MQAQEEGEIAAMQAMSDITSELLSSPQQKKPGGSLPGKQPNKKRNLSMPMSA
jgi:hypothetical protein